MHRLPALAGVFPGSLGTGFGLFTLSFGALLRLFALGFGFFPFRFGALFGLLALRFGPFLGFFTLGFRFLALRRGFIALRRGFLASLLRAGFRVPLHAVALFLKTLLGTTGVHPDTGLGVNAQGRVRRERGHGKRQHHR